MDQYCMKCGASLRLVQLEGRERSQCPQCGWVFYPQLKVGSAAMIIQDGQVLLARRSHEPWRGYWYLPAGYVEVDETPEAAAIRETLEETGLRIAVDHLAGVYAFNDDPRGNGVLLVYRCSVTGGELEASPETDAFGYFAADTMPSLIAGAGHSDAIQDWLRGAV